MYRFCPKFTWIFFGTSWLDKYNLKKVVLSWSSLKGLSRGHSPFLAGEHDGAHWAEDGQIGDEVVHDAEDSSEGPVAGEQKVEVEVGIEDKR